MRLDADLAFSVKLPTSGGAERSARGTIRADGSHVEIDSDEIRWLAARATVSSIRRTGEMLARHGITLSIRGPNGVIVSIGDVKQPWVHRVMMRSPHIRLGALRDVLGVARERRRAGGSSFLNVADLIPPPTMFPVTPMFDRVPRRVTTTHGPPGSGAPRLFFAPGPVTWPGDKQRIVYLEPEVTTIGSDPECDLCLEGLDDLQAEIRRNEVDDEYVLIPLSQGIESTVNGHVGERLLLRTGAQIEFGGWKMSYYREEFADHGRPYGGRLGGEIGHQKSQPKRRYG